MQGLIDELHARLGRIRAINVPEPAMSLIRHLEHIPSWREQLRHIGRKYTTPEYQLLLTAAIEWLDTGYCIKKEEYKRREKALRESFGEMYTTHILEDPVVAQQRMAQRERAHSAGNNNKPSTPYDSFGAHVMAASPWAYHGRVLRLILLPSREYPRHNTACESSTSS
eukprot:CAMPEP_0185016922 /NCGR_PEP_ID=MMETSP1098-20130426/100628_1 /TAXON_ID=89044 /ORGANISM="Spumella elongata, Strain CCAP 955/1" /LENGTH=167 /DNA_ID=CAMNT_0027546149 /DNA_START=968 /DNA_END=1469 /DNA_ORIENTATION=+